MTEPSTLRCLAGPSCRNAVTIDGQRLGAMNEHPNTLCPACDKAISSAIRQLPRDWAELRAALGERSTTTGAKVNSTPTPAMPISARKEALMAAIVDLTDHAADIVSEQLDIQRASALRKPPADAEEGSIAWNAAEHTQPEPQKTLAAAIALIEPHIELLITAPEQPTLAWQSPRRCAFHAAWIESAERQLAQSMKMPGIADAEPKTIRKFLRNKFRLKAKHPAKVRGYLDALNDAYRSAGGCENCGGWCKDGQAREIIEHTGAEILQQLINLHHQARAELGHTRLRHRYPMPCPRCGGRVGRDDGQTIVTCDDRDQCKSSWTEREYQFLAGLITRERYDMEITKYLLAEAYARLDAVQQRIEVLDNIAELIDELGLPAEAAVIGRQIAESFAEAIDGHKTPEQRAITTARKDTEQRQDAEDTWAWGGNEPRYQRPKPKPKKATRPAGPPIHPSSLLTVIDTDEHAALNGRLKCADCNLIHPGDCA
ncbi:hypothetical protein A9W98_18040 [Mycobacterium gordonae]|uniref:Uncharacterized protein n=1 Tax=Mycobacterium gordonae TaxID=1778 RepID=A0A1A6BHT2_MYCGO|nr:hypothetical protein [Mycobacterium gordonae]OBS01883.1 hypothetical protein A9W98_18040 [Mycobacterium gordonae]